MSSLLSGRILHFPPDHQFMIPPQNVLIFERAGGALLPLP
jgi:hypothetical protein